MADEKKIPNLMLESEIPAEWQPMDSKPIIPSVPTNPPSAGDSLPPYFRGSIAATLQHDVSLVSTGKNLRQANTPLMPLAPSGNPQNNAAIESDIILNNKQTTTTSVTGGFKFRGYWLPFVDYSVGDVVIFNVSTYIANSASVGLQPDLNSVGEIGESTSQPLTSSAWSLLSENLVFKTSISSSQQAGVGPMIGNVFTFNGATGPLSIVATPAQQFPQMIAIVQTQVDNASSLASTPAGWNLLIDPGTGNTFPASGSSNTFYYKVFTGGSLSFTSNLNSNGPWQATMSFFQFGGFSSFNITNVSISGTTATFTCSNSLAAGNLVNLSGLAGASFLNGLLTQVLSTGLSSTQFEAAVPSGHNGYNAADSGTATQTIVQYTGWTSGAGGSFTASLTGVKLNSVLVAQEVSGGTSYSGATFSSRTTPPPPEPTDSNTPPNGYTVGNASGGASVGGSLSGIAAVTYSTPNNAAGSITITVTASGAFLDASGIGAFELPGGANVPAIYKPYNVIEFRGSTYVCLSETSSDPFIAPLAWGLIGPATGYAQTKTGNYLVVQNDEGNLLSFNSSSPVTLTLLNPLPTVNGLTDSGWWIQVENIGTGLLTINPNGLLLDGSSSNITLGQNQGMTIFTDAANYLTWHGVNRITVPSFLTASVPDGSGQVTIASAIVSPSFAVIGPTACSASGPLTARQIQGSDLLNLSVTSVSQTGNTTTVTGTLKKCGSTVPAGVYRVSVYAVITSASSGTLTATIAWNDGTASQSFSPSSISTSVVGTIIQFDSVVRSDGVHDISYTFTLA